MNKYLSIYICFPILFLFGCSTTPDMNVSNREGIDSRRLEKRIDDLSSTITFIVNDTNRLHNDVEEVKTIGKDIQQKIEGLEVTVRDLNERIITLNASLKPPEIVQPPAEETYAKPQVTIADSSKPETGIQETAHTEDPMAIAKGYWDAVIARDLSTIMLYATKDSLDGFKMGRKDANTKNEVIFGEIEAEDDKIIIETTLLEITAGSEVKIPVQTILTKKEGQWKVDARQTMMSAFGGAAGEMVKGLGKAMEEMGKSMAEGIEKGIAEMTKPAEEKPEVTETAPEQQTPVVSEETKVEDEQKGDEEAAQTSQKETDTIPPKEEIPMTGEPPQRESYLRENIVHLAEEQFPDNKGIQWNILSFEHKEHLTYVEVEPAPATVGYPRFKFVVSFKEPAMPRVIGLFCFKDGQYNLMAVKKK